MEHTPIVVGNWKMNPETKREAVKLIDGTKTALPSTSGIDVTLCVPSVFLPAAKEALGNSKKFTLGAQDVFWSASGSHTGEISPTQLIDAGVRRVIIGHSERRALGETSEQVAQKAAFALSVDLDVTLCIGEHKRDDDGDYLHWLERQIRESLDGVSGKYLGQITIAYEPIWAIGGDEAMKSAEIHEMVIFIRRAIGRLYSDQYAGLPRIIYGGSVNADNIADIMENGEVNGVLPGRASREPEQFAEIVRTVKKYGGR